MNNTRLLLAAPTLLLAISACSSSVNEPAAPASAASSIAPARGATEPRTDEPVTTTAAPVVAPVPTTRSLPPTTLASIATPPPAANGAATLVWVGTGTAHRYDNGRWVRSPQLDYHFEVLQRRDGRTWKSVKNLRFDAPGYDGAAGEPEQILHFDLTFDAPTGARKVTAAVNSTLGKGSTTSDVEFRDMALTITLATPTPMYDTFRITQRYDYEAGRLTETVDLMLRQPDGTLTPVFRNEEVATLFARTTFPGPPTVAI